MEKLKISEESRKDLNEEKRKKGKERDNARGEKQGNTFTSVLMDGRVPSWNVHPREVWILSSSK